MTSTDVRTQLHAARQLLEYTASLPPADRRMETLRLANYCAPWIRAGLSIGYDIIREAGDALLEAPTVLDAHRFTSAFLDVPRRLGPIAALTSNTHNRQSRDAFKQWCCSFAIRTLEIKDCPNQELYVAQLLAAVVAVDRCRFDSQGYFDRNEVRDSALRRLLGLIPALPIWHRIATAGTISEQVVLSAEERAIVHQLIHDIAKRCPVQMLTPLEAVLRRCKLPLHKRWGLILRGTQKAL